MEKFYQQGLKFECTGCGECCKIPGGQVEISEKEAEGIAEYMDLPVDILLDDYCTITKGRILLKENTRKACIFLKENRCIVYPVRPLQCRTFPFWPENLEAISRWERLGDYCPGINSGEFFSFHRIQKISRRQETQDREQVMQQIGGKL